jgi:hypothetical protein
LPRFVKLDNPFGISRHHKRFRAQRRCLPDQAGARPISQYEIRRQQVGNACLENTGSLRNCGDSNGAVAGFLEEPNELLARLRLGVDD